ncbi:MAG: SOS response-associated peptidase [Vicinamibacteria bacterium]|nr:SOS response-associated peptidase [Vicinamibacteria bacterium]
MCGRFTLTTPGEELAMYFSLDKAPLLQPRYNIAPNQSIAVVRRPSAVAAPRLDTVRWGLVPRWARDPARQKPLINARAETLAEKPSFRDAFRCRRCLVPADGFYEWKTAGQDRNPHLFHLRNGGPFAIAGLWEPSLASGEQDSCAIVTTDANALLRGFHDRMPVILPKESHGLWLDIDLANAEDLLVLLRPYPAEEMCSRAVSRGVNNPRFDDPSCIAPVLS